MAEIVLTPGQRAAVESRGCALLVAAAAGSGKTRVLIDRVLDSGHPRGAGALTNSCSSPSRRRLQRSCAASCWRS